MSRRFPINLRDDELRKYLQELETSWETIFGTLNGPFYARATLSADLNSGAAVTINGKTFRAVYVLEGYKLVDTCVVGGFWNSEEEEYDISSWSKCEVLQ